MSPHALAALVMLAGLVSSALPAIADPVCSQAAVSSQGEPARFEWLAKTKARANWRAKVRALSELGPDYANWNIAAERSEICSDGPDGVTCLFTGTPCKK